MGKLTYIVFDKPQDHDQNKDDHEVKDTNPTILKNITISLLEKLKSETEAQKQKIK